MSSNTINAGQLLIKQFKGHAGNCEEQQKVLEILSVELNQGLVSTADAQTIVGLAKRSRFLEVGELANALFEDDIRLSDFEDDEPLPQTNSTVVVPFERKL